MPSLRRHPYGHSIPLAGTFAARSAPCLQTPAAPPAHPQIFGKQAQKMPFRALLHDTGYRSVPLFRPESRREQRHPGHQLNSLHRRMHPRHRRILPWLLCYYWAFIITRCVCFGLWCFRFPLANFFDGRSQTHPAAGLIFHRRPRTIVSQSPTPLLLARTPNATPWRQPSSRAGRTSTRCVWGEFVSLGVWAKEQGIASASTGRNLK